MQKRILLIEDDADIRDLYKMALTNEGYTVDEAATGQAGLSALNQQAYDLLLLDILLPDTNGIEILKKIKADKQTKHIPVIITSNLGDEAIVKEGLALGAMKYLVKAEYIPPQIVLEVKKAIG